jgi:O-succinylhomoserine sulfhydrylase
LTDHPHHGLAARQQSGFGGVLSFEVRDCAGKADRDAAWRFIDATRLVSITANLGDVKTTITHPGTTTHGRVAEEEKRRAGISDNLIRVAVGLEGLEDLKADMRRGLAGLGFGE